MSLFQHFGAKDFDLNDVKLKYRVGHYLNSKMHHLEAFHDGNKIGHLKWAWEPNDFEAPGEIADVDVDREYQNKGVATKMFLEAHDMWRRGEVKERPYHSYQSDAAEDWIDSLKKKNPEFGVTRYDLDEKYPDDLDHYSDWHKSALLQHFGVKDFQGFHNEIEDSLEGLLSDEAEESRENWNLGLKWPKKYLEEASHPGDGFEHRDAFHRNLQRLGLVDEDGMVALRRIGKPKAQGIVNASIHPTWGDKNNDNYGHGSKPGLYEWKAPLNHLIGVGHVEEGEVFVKSPGRIENIKSNALFQHFAAFQRESVVEYHEDYDQPTDDMADNVPDDGYLAAREKHNRKIEKQREKNVGILFDADAEYNDRKLEHNEKLSNLNHEFVSALQPHKQKLGDAEEAYKPHFKALRESIEKNWEDHPDDEKARDLAQVSISAAHQPHQDAISGARAEYKKRESEVRESFMPRSNALRAELADHAEINQQVHQKANDDVRDLMDKRKKDLTENHPPQLRFVHDLSGRLDLNGWVMKAYHGNRHIGELHWSDGSDPDKYKKGEIAWIGVHPKYRNVGVATEMMRRARKHAEDNPDVARPEHSDNRTDMGMAWHQRLVQKDPTLASLRVKASMDFEWSGYREPEPEPESHKGVDDPYIKARRVLFDKYKSENDKVNDSLQKVYGDLIDESNGKNGGYYRSPKYNSISKNMNRLQDKRRMLNPKFYEDTEYLPHPENVQYEFHSSDDGVDRVAAFHHGEFVGHIAWHRKDRQWRYRPYSAGEVHLVEVHPEYRRHGIGTGLFREARAAHERGDSPARPEHSKNKTNAGISWSDAMISKDPTLASLRATGSAIWSSEDPRSDFYEGPKPEPDSHEGVDDPFLNARRKALHDYQAKAKPLLNEGADLREKRRKLHQWHTRAAAEILKQKGPTPIYERVPELVDLDAKYQSKISPLWVKQHENADAHTRVVGEYSKALRAAPDPENVTHHFSYDANNDHHIVAMHHGKKVGYLKWNDEADGYHGDGEIKMIEVHPDYQRHGIATNMMKHARYLYDRGEVGQSPEHSDDRTDDGDAWISQLPPSLSLLQYFASDEDPLLKNKSVEDLHEMYENLDPLAPGDDGASDTKDIPFADTHELIADWVGARPNEVQYDLKHIPADKLAHRKHDFDDDSYEKAYVHGMAEHLRSGGTLPPLMAVDVPSKDYPSEEYARDNLPFTILDGAHRASAHVIAGSKTIPVWVGSKKIQPPRPKQGLLQHFANDEDPFLTIKKQEDAKLQAVRHGSDEEWSNAWKTYTQNMRNAPHPKNVEYKFHYVAGHGDDMHAVTAHHNGEEVGHLRWADDTHGEWADFTGYFPGEISNIDVDPEYQRHGIATKMMERAREAGNSREATTRPEHSESLTPAGKVWINSLPSHLSSL